MKRIILLLLLSLFLLPVFCCAGGIVIIANPDIQESSLSQKDIEDIFLSKKKSLSGGAVKPIVQQADSLHELFLKTYVNKSPAQFKSYYKKLVFSGSGKAPHQVADDSAAVAYVASTPGTIGYVSDGAALDGVKTITVQ